MEQNSYLAVYWLPQEAVREFYTVIPDPISYRWDTYLLMGLLLDHGGQRHLRLEVR